MPFQSAVRLVQGAGVPGERAYDSPSRVFPYNLTSSPQLNVVGATAYTVTTPANDTTAGIAAAGGAGEFAGILVDPKSYALYGNGTFQGALAPTLDVPDGTIGQLATMGIYFVILTTAAAVGNLLCYNTTTGALASYVSGALPGGFTAIPNGKVILRATAANGLAIVQLTD